MRRLFRVRPNPVQIGGPRPPVVEILTEGRGTQTEVGTTLAVAIANRCCEVELLFRPLEALVTRDGWELGWPRGVCGESEPGTTDGEA